MNMNTELLNDTLDENFEETDSEDYNENESEMEERETEVSEDIQRRADDGDLKKFPLRATRGRVILRYFVTQESSTDDQKDVFQSNYSCTYGVQSSYLYDVSYEVTDFYYKHVFLLKMINIKQKHILSSGDGWSPKQCTV
ncbi:hypothetical protein AVEN_86318-1 [Araneus ventricosus]|uniref:Uncharacterized protein n=1 Tax=Araneus ventricosus TaxID=182803 RepID=A0A4Y2IHG5_ARAVE|nr:hypothetical protein AVEN_86318-1 [Araneus ventricosus]